MRSKACPTPAQVALLKSVGWLAGRSGKAQDLILSIGRVRSYEHGEFLYRVGDRATCMFGLIDGRLDMILPAPDGREIVVHMSTPGNWFAETTTLSRATIKAACRVASDAAEVLALRDVDLFALLDREPWLHTDFYALSNEKRTIAQDLLVEALTFTGVERVAQRLAYLHAKKRLGPEDQVEVSQDALSEMVGVSGPTVQRALRAFRRRGLIETRYGRIRIIDAEGLAAFRQHGARTEIGHGETGEEVLRRAVAEADRSDEPHQAMKSHTATAE